MAHVGQEQRLGLGGRFGLVAGGLQVRLDLRARGQIFLDGLRHRVHGDAQGEDFLDRFRLGVAAGRIVAIGEIAGLVAEGVDGLQHAPAHDHQGQSHDRKQQEVHGHRQADEARHPRRSLRHRVLCARIGQAGQIGNGAGQVGTILLIRL